MPDVTIGEDEIILGDGRRWALAVDPKGNSVSITTESAIVKTVSFNAWRADASAVVQSVDGYNRPEPELTIEEKVSALEKQSAALRETFTEKGLITKSEIDAKISGARK